MREEANRWFPGSLLGSGREAPRGLAVAITRAASKQTYHTIRFLVDRDRIVDAFRAYAYFRWVDDVVDGESGSLAERCAFLNRQKSLLDASYRGHPLEMVYDEEAMLIDLVKGDDEPCSGLQIYLRNMMEVMDFDARRRGRLISRVELNNYTGLLASAVTEAMHYFIGHGRSSPRDETRYLAVAGAHITHMLRDTFDDLRAGYYNIPREVLEAGHFDPQDLHSNGQRAWIKSRVALARQYFNAGRNYLARVEDPRCRLAGIAYMARFKSLLNTFETDDYCLRADYCERKRAETGLYVGVLALSTFFNWGGMKTSPDTQASHSWRKL